MRDGSDKRILERPQENLQDERRFVEEKLVVGMGAEVEIDGDERNGDERKTFPRRLMDEFTDVSERGVESVIAAAQDKVEENSPENGTREK